MAKYIYVSDGLGVPGLPHELTDRDAKALGVADILKAALEAGTYQEKKRKPAKKAGED